MNASPSHLHVADRVVGGRQIKLWNWACWQPSNSRHVVKVLDGLQDEGGEDVKSETIAFDEMTEVGRRAAHQAGVSEGNRRISKLLC